MAHRMTVLLAELGPGFGGLLKPRSPRHTLPSKDGEICCARQRAYRVDSRHSSAAAADRVARIEGARAAVPRSLFGRAVAARAVARDGQGVGNAAVARSSVCHDRSIGVR